MESVGQEKRDKSYDPKNGGDIVDDLVDSILNGQPHTILRKLG
jgi:hypothetical protein